MSNAKRVTGVLGVGLLIVGLLAGPGMHSAHAGDEVVEIEIVADTTTVQDLLNKASEQLGLQFIWSGSEKALRNAIQGRPVFRGSKKAVFGSLRSLLLTYDLILMPIGPEQEGQKATYRVADMRASSVLMSLRPESIALDSPESLAALDAQPWRFVTTTIHLEHAIDLRNMRTAIAKIVTGASIGQVTEVPDARALVVTDFAPKVAAAYRMVRRMDVEPPAPRTGPRLVVIKVEYARARELAQLVDRLLVRGKGVAVAVPRVVADDRTNQVVISGDAGPVAQIETMIKQLDVPGLPRKPLPPRPPVTGKVVRLAHMQAGDAAGALSAFVRGAHELFDDRPTVVALASANALVIAGTERAHKVLGDLIASLDRAQDDEEKTEEKGK